jgi:hypothetical protein
MVKMYFLISALLVAFTLSASDSNKLSIIMLNNATRIEQKTSLPQSFLEKKYMIEANHVYVKKGALFTAKLRGAVILAPVAKKEFEQALKNTKLLYLGQYSSLSSIFKKPWFLEQINQFLSEGGCVFFDYLSLKNGFQAFFEKVNLVRPSDYKPGYYNASITEKYRDDPLFTVPNKISGKIKAYGNWNVDVHKAEAPLCDFTDPERAAMIIYKNVSGKGMIICNQCPGIFRKPSPLIENLLSFILKVNLKKNKARLEEESGGPGEPAR